MKSHLLECFRKTNFRFTKGCLLKLTLFRLQRSEVQRGGEPQADLLHEHFSQVQHLLPRVPGREVSP